MNSPESDWSGGWQSDDSVPSLSCLGHAMPSRCGKGPTTGMVDFGGTFGAAEVNHSVNGGGWTTCSRRNPHENVGTNSGGTLGAAVVGKTLNGGRDRITNQNRFAALQHPEGDQPTTHVKLEDYITEDNHMKKAFPFRKVMTKAEKRQKRLNDIKEDNKKIIDGMGVRTINELDVDVQVVGKVTKKKLIDEAFKIWDNRRGY